MGDRFVLHPEQLASVDDQADHRARYAQAIAEELGGAAKGLIYALLAIDGRLKLIEDALRRADS